MKYLPLLLILLTQTSLNATDIQREQLIMGTFVSITLDKKNEKEIQKGFTLLKKIEKSLSSYDKQSLLYQLNLNKSVISDRFLLECIQKSLLFYKLSNAYFNIAIGSVTKKLYAFGEEEEKIPTKNELALANTKIKNIHIKKNLITLEKNITLDLGGIGKGFAVDKVAQYYKEQNISHGTIALSGDIRCLDICSLELQSPYSEQTFATLTSKIPHLSISTSGTYRRFIKSPKHHHLINPKTIKQGTAFVSVSLLTEANNTQIDAYATAISVMPKNKALEFLKTHPEIGFVLVNSNAEIKYGNLKKFVTVQWKTTKNLKNLHLIN
ncbi:MAG: Thiamin biosynthesis lipoprotein ApbE [uncultured Sulfurovum sp.]|uniref:FAD:protein FMN transferase n=1 Tax=uncultured Sulfurovum sp. TaxID=269237 RepID=A0A6S6UE68_9BACT|nr:MAG: Thiamin biosynthesis lipoprotein ApbE [uncultured Sulfurovum sp.]